MNYLDLFSGLGGFALGAYWAGWRFDEHYFSEVDDYAIRVYQQRFPEAINLGDITKIVEKPSRTGTGDNVQEIENERGRGSEDRGAGIRQENGQTCTSGITTAGNDGWIITGGFPCQDISCAGKGEGITGSRSGLWFAMRDVIRLLRPRYVIAENVGAITYRGFDAVLASLAEIGYDAEWQDIRASDVGAPHRRERIWIMAYPDTTGWRERCGAESIQKTHTSSKGLSDRDAGKNREGAYIQFAGNNSRRKWDGWSVEPDVGRVAHGIPSRVDRLKCLGNSIVPQIAEILFRRIAEVEGCMNDGR